MHVDVPGSSIAVTDEGGRGERAVVLVHSGVGDRHEWDLVAGRLDGLRLVRLDLRGFGESEVGGEPYAHHDDVLAVMDALAIERPTLVGASFGGLVALEAAATAPERFDRLVLLAPALSGHTWSDAMRAFGDAEDQALERGDVDEAVRLNVELWAGRLASDLQDRVAASQRRAFALQGAALIEADELHPPVADRLAAITMPARVLVGDADIADFPAIAARLARELPDAERTTLPGAGHLLALERPDAVARAIAAG